MGDLFETSVANVNQQIIHILEEGELDANSVIKEYIITAADGKPYRTKYYRIEITSQIAKC